MKKRILFVYTNYSTFVNTDFEILSSEFEVTKYQFKPTKGISKITFQFIKQLSYSIVAIWKFNRIFIWFADYHSFWPVFFAKLLRKKSFVVVGGYDVANIPELKYGSLASPLRKMLTLFTYRNVTLCLAVAEVLEIKIKKVCPKANTMTLYTGYKIDDNIKIHSDEKREKIVLTVSITNSKQRILIKGLDRFINLAKELTEFKFIIIGVSESSISLFDPVPSNILFLPPLNQSELKDFYLRSSFYAQFSRSEGLPNALCEAMLFGCIPLGTNVGGISTVIGTTGLLIDNWNIQTVADYIVSNHNSANREACSFRIKEKFDIKFRKEKLLKLM